MPTRWQVGANANVLVGSVGAMRVAAHQRDLVDLHLAARDDDAAIGEFAHGDGARLGRAAGTVELGPGVAFQCQRARLAGVARTQHGFPLRRFAGGADFKEAAVLQLGQRAVGRRPGADNFDPACVAVQGGRWKPFHGQLHGGQLGILVGLRSPTANDQDAITDAERSRVASSVLQGGEGPHPPVTAHRFRRRRRDVIVHSGVRGAADDQGRAFILAQGGRRHEGRAIAIGDQ